MRELSYTRTLTKTVEQQLKEHGVTAVHWDLRRVPLPIADPRFHKDPARHSDTRVQSLVKLAANSHAFVLASPIYHNSYSGVLKNALDHLAIPQFYWKPVGLISHGGNRSMQAVDQMRIVVRGLLGVTIPTQVCTSTDDYFEIAEAEYKIVNPDIMQRINRFTLELIAFAEQLVSLRKLSTTK